MNIFADSTTLMHAYGQTTDRLNVEQAQLYAKLVAEEVSELGDALEALGPALLSIEKQVDALAEVGDALIDIIVVVSGLGNSLGLPMQEMWDEVYRSNVSKLHDGKIVKREDGKVLKGPNYSPPDLATVIRRAVTVRQNIDNALG